MAFRSVGFILAALMTTIALAQTPTPVDVFKAVSDLPCTQLEQNLATLQDLAGNTYSLAIAGRAGPYQDMQAQLNQLKYAPVPYANEDLSQQPLEQVTGLQKEYRQVPRQVAAPQWGYGLLNIGLAGAFGYATYAVLDTPNPNTSLAAGGLILTLAAGGAAVASFAHTRTVYDQKFDARAAASNQRIRDRVAQDNDRIQKQNAVRKQHLEERQTVIAKNQKVADARQSIVAKMTAFEKQSKALAVARINALDSATNRRCLDKLVYEGAAVRLGTQEAFVYLIVRPLNPTGTPLPNAGGLPSLSFGVQALTLADPLGPVTEVKQPPVANVVPASSTPLRTTFPTGSVAMEFSVRLDSPVAVPEQLSVDADIAATQDGRTFHAQAQGHVQLVP